MTSMAERIKEDDPGRRELKITRGSGGSFGKKAEVVAVRRLSEDEEASMILSGLENMVTGAGSTGFGDFVKRAVAGANGQVHGYVDENGMPHSNPPAGATTGFGNFMQRQAGDGREDHNYTEQQKVTQPTTGFGAGEGIDTKMEEDRRDTLDDGGVMSTAELMQRIQELIPKEERFRIPPEKQDLPPKHKPEQKAKEAAAYPLDKNGVLLNIGDPVTLGSQKGTVDELDPTSSLVSVNFDGLGSVWESSSNLEKVAGRRMADDSTPDGTQWQSEVVDETNLRTRDLPDIPEALPEKYVPEKGDGSHPLPNESFEDWGTPPVPGVSQNYPEDPAKITNIMASLTRIRLTDGRVLIGKVLKENDLKIQFLGRMAGDRSDTSFEIWKQDIVGPREAVRLDSKRRSREVTNLEAAYDLYKSTCEAKDPKKDYAVEKAVVSPSDGVDRSVEKATNTRGAGKMKTTASNDIYTQLQEAGCETDSHESDLYVKVTPESTAIIDQYEFKDNVTTFKSQIDGQQWYDIPFANSPFWADKTASEIHHEASRKLAAQKKIADGGDFSGSVIYCPHCDYELGTFDGAPEDFDPASYQRCPTCGGVLDIKPDLVMASKTAADLGLCDECHKNPAVATFVALNGDDVNYCADCADYLGAQIKPGFVAGKKTAAEEDKGKKVTPSTAPKDNVAANDTMKDDSFYGDDKALHDQLDKHEKRASVLKREATTKLKMADNYEKAGNMKMAKEMDKQGTALYNEWQRVTTTMAGIRKKIAESRKVTASAKPPRMFFETPEPVGEKMFD